MRQTQRELQRTPHCHDDAVCSYPVLFLVRGRVLLAVSCPASEQSGYFGETEGFTDIKSANAFVESQTVLIDRGAAYVAPTKADGDSAAAEIQIKHPGDNGDAGV